MGASRRKRLNTSSQQVRCGPWDCWPSHDSIMKPRAGGFLEITGHPVSDRRLTRTSLNPTLNTVCKYARSQHGPACAIICQRGNMHVGPLAPRYETGILMHERMSARWFVLSARANKQSHRATLDQTTRSTRWAMSKPRSRCRACPSFCGSHSIRFCHGLHLLAAPPSFASRS